MAKLYDYRLGAGVLGADERVEELISSGNYFTAITCCIILYIIITIPDLL